MEATAQQEVTAVDHAMDQLATAVDHLVKVVDDGGLDHYEFSELVGFMQSFEQVRNRLPLVDHRVIADGERRGLADALSQPSMRRVLVHLLRLAPGEASRRVAAAEACGTRVSMLGEVLAPRRPHLAAAQRLGSVTPDQVHLTEQALRKVDRPGFDPTEIDAAEALLTDFATVFGAKDLKLLAAKTVEAMDPDGTLPDEQLATDRRHFTLHPCRDGTYSGEFRLTGPLGAKLTALLGPLARPRIDSLGDPGCDTVADQAAVSGARVAREVDERTFGQRMHDALDELCDRVLQSGTVTGIGGTPATVIITMTAENLLDRLGYGTTTDGTLIPTKTVLQLANEAEIIPTVLNRTGAVLELGRSRRIASSTQTYALIARDHGCSFPGCDRPPEWCERHHIVEWADGGATDLDNLTLLCRYHHHNFAGRGWTCRINEGGLPEWTPPRWLDRSQKPLINSRILAHRDPSQASTQSVTVGVRTAAQSGSPSG